LSRAGCARARRLPSSAASRSFSARKSRSAVAWLQSVALTGLRMEDFTDREGQPDRRVVEDASAGPLWARFYELETNRPIFLGRDRVVRYRLSEIERERRAGYAYYGQWPAPLLATEYPAWRKAGKADAPSLSSNGSGG
jgi:PelA/Pel-15E family pectate lyase